MSDAKLTFGKYRGRKLSNVPSDYLRWCLEDCRSLSEMLREQIEEEMRSRGELDSETDEPLPTEDLNALGQELAESVTMIYRQLAMQYHPDRSGSPDAMQAINEFRLQVQNLIKRTCGKS